MIRIIAIGSPFFNDDISYRALNEIKQTLLSKHPAIDICHLDRPGMQLVNELKDVNCAIVIDALLSDHTPGSIIQLNEDQLDTNNNDLSSHDLSVPEAIKLARQLAVIPKQLFILGISIKLDEALAHEQFSQCCEQLLAQLDAICTQASTD